MSEEQTEDLDMSLEEYIAVTMNQLKLFKMHYKRNSQKSPESWPLRLSSGLWDIILVFREKKPIQTESVN